MDDQPSASPPSRDDGPPSRNGRWLPFLPNSLLVLCAALFVGGGLVSWAVFAKKIPIDGLLSRLRGIAGDPGTTNHLRPADLWAPGAQGSLRALAAGPLVDAGGRLPDLPALAAGSSGRRDLLEVLVHCALAPGQSVVDPADNDLRLPGALGLAPSWAERGLSVSQKQAVTGCLLERLNARGNRVSLLLEGAGLRPGEGQRARYPRAESAAWGNLFDGAAMSAGETPAPAAYVCSERGGGSEPTRVCSQQENECGLSWEGYCDEVEERCARTPGAGVCEAWGQRIKASLR